MMKNQPETQAQQGANITTYLDLLYMSEDLKNALRQLNPTGQDGFEGLIAQLLEELTGQHFHLAKSGTQLGRDLSASNLNSNVIAVECKRYKEETKLDERELSGELVQVVKAIPDLDLWVLVASRDVPSQLDEFLRSAANDYGVTYIAISSDDGSPSSLEILCAHAINLVIKHLNNDPKISNIKQFLENIANSNNFNEKVENLRNDFLSPLIGFSNWQTEQNQYFLQCLKSEKESRALFGQPINIEDDSIKLIKREAIWASLDEWFNQWKAEPELRPFVVLGEEGDGKTWSVASWLSNKLKQAEEFSPVLFLSSTNVNSNEPEILFLEVISRRLPALQQEQWKKRIARWTKRAISDTPLFIVVLDGINERRNPEWWRTLIEKLDGQPWLNQVAVLITCRSAYWQRHFEQLFHIKAVTYTLLPYNDKELDEALANNKLYHSDIRDALLPLIRKPRYFDLMVKYRQKIEETGDVTVARLIYEDWRDRLQRKRSILLDDKSFQSLICSLTNDYKQGSKSIREQDICNSLSSYQDKQSILEELRTGGILENQREKYQVKEIFLVYGFGLLLVDELEKSSEEQDKDLNDILAEWLEPHAEMDIKAKICGFAALHALSLYDYPQKAKIALLQAWVNSHNPEQAVENDFISYFPVDPQCYIELAEIVWSNTNGNAWAQELLMQSFLRWYKSPSSNIVLTLRSAFERWLGFVHIHGFPSQRHTSAVAERLRREISERIGCQLQTGQQKNFGNYVITAIEDDGLLRLGRVALAVISHLVQDRGFFIHAIATGCLAEAIMSIPNKYDLFTWLFWASPESVWEEVKVEVERFLTIDHPFAQEAAYRLLTFEGSQEAYQLQQTLPQDSVQPHPLVEIHRQDPCTSSFQWTQGECEICLHREDLKPRQIVTQIKEHCVNPNLSVPNNLGQRLKLLTQDISVQQVKIDLNSTTDDYLFKDYEPVLCAYTPEAMADLVRRITLEIEQRKDVSLRQLSLTLNEYTLIFGSQEQDSIYRAWTKLINNANSWSEVEKLAEAFLFKLVLATQSAEEQLLSLLKRPENSIDLITCEAFFLPINNWDVVCNNLAPDSNFITIQRVLWFLSCHPEALPQNILKENLTPFFKHEDSVVRSLILQILYFLKNRELINVIINSDWAWKANLSDLENHWGSLLLSKYATLLPYSELFSRIHPIYLGYAIQCRGINKDEVSQYADNIHQILMRLNTEVRDLPANCPSISIKASILNEEDIVMVHLKSLSKSSSSQSVTFFSIDAYWGGIDKVDRQKLQGIMPDNEQQQPQTPLQTIKKVIKEQEKAGNILFAERFFPHILDQVVNECPDLVNQWLEAIFDDNNQTKRQLHLASCFYEELCAVLLKNDSCKGIKLYWYLKNVERKVRIKDIHSEFELLDYAFFKAPSSDLAKSAWTKKLEQCKTDRELMKIAVLAQYGNGTDWLWSNITLGIQSVVAIEKSRAITLLAFMQDKKAIETLSSLIQEQPDTWIKNLLEISQKRWQKNSWAMHWFHRFFTADDDVKSWVSFRLFLHCIDSRFWFWWKQVEDEISGSPFIEKKQKFLQDNLETIKQRIQNNEQSLEKQYLGHKILHNQAWPWM